MENNKMHDIAGPIEASDRVSQYAGHKQQLDNKVHGVPAPIVFKRAPHKAVNDQEFMNAAGSYSGSSKG